jgi:predicted DNA repair protein MutK
VQDSAFMTQLAVLSGIAILMTVGVYGLVAGIVKLDDAGLHLSRKTGFLRSLGLGIVAAAPWLMKGLSIAGTAAMFLVGGGILTHGFGFLHHAIEALTARAGSVLGAITPLLADAVVGIVAGALVLAAVTLAKKLLPRRAAP